MRLRRSILWGSLWVLVVASGGTATQAQTNEDILKRLEALERENRELKRQMGSSSTAAPAPRSGLETQPLPPQTTPGWWVHIYDWNARGVIERDPGETFRYDQQKFNVTIGCTARSAPECTSAAVFRFEGWLRVAKAGTYQIGARLATPWRHSFNLTMKIGGITVYEQKRMGADGIHNDIAFVGRALDPGDYRIEYIWGISTLSFIKYNPAGVVMEPMLRGPDDMNFRPFNDGELLVPDRHDVRLGPSLLWQTW